MNFGSMLNNASKSDLANAKSLMSKVRELESTSPTEMVAFVDDGNDSFDVHIRFDSTKTDIASVSCDCGASKSMCQHALAVLLALKSGQTDGGNAIIVKKIKRKKLSPLEEIIDATDMIKIRSWLIDELSNNKELALKFTNTFAEKQLSISQESIKEQGDIIKKAVLGRKKIIEGSQLKPIFEHWTKYIESNIQSIIRCIVDDLNVEIYLQIQLFYDGIFLATSGSVSRISTHRNKTFTYINAFVSERIDADCDLILKRFISIFVEKRNMFAYDIFIQQYNEYKLRLSREQMVDVIKIIISNYEYSYLSEAKLLYILTLIKEDGLLDDLYPELKAVGFANQYNLELCDILISKNELDTVLELCKKAISSNYYEHYNIPYYKKMMEVYSLRGDSSLFSNLHKTIFTLSPSYEGYKDIIALMKDEKEIDSFKKECLELKVHMNKSDYRYVLDVKFGIWNDDGRYDLILDRIKDEVSFDKMMPYIDSLMAYEKYKLLGKILTCIDDDYSGNILLQYQSKLEVLICTHFTKIEFMHYSNRRFRYTLKPFIQKIENLL